jgi:hypothetical protein
MGSSISPIFGNQEGSRALREDEVRIYYGVCDRFFLGWRKGYLPLASIMPDGWAGYEP